jgi:asparaginyl-tRNA synthetase
VRAQKTFAFMEVNDGSGMSGIQVVLSDSSEGYHLVEAGKITTGCSVEVIGALVQSPGGRQAMELQAHTLELIGMLHCTSALLAELVLQRLLLVLANWTWGSKE